MSQEQMDKVYNPKAFEERIYQQWQENGCFQPNTASNQPPFVVVIPPPNVTGVLHMGHGLNNSLQDILVRFYRMKGRPTLWVPGTDHAGIATQNVVERRLAAQGLNRHTLGREAFLEATWKVKEAHHRIIVNQLKKIGASCDWSRERFTLDEGLSKAVREVFVSLYEKGLIYKGNYLVNWCPSCTTALADDEVEHEETPGFLYHYRYPFADGSGSIEIATTRPETMFGDTAVAVHPEDPRYRAWIGKQLILPLTDRRIPLIADTYVDREFGTGAVKITPAHDPNDWEIGCRHHLEKINILNPDGTLNEHCPGEFRGLSCEAARKLTVQRLKEGGFFLGQEERSHQVGHCYRCHSVIEPYLSSQWFVRMKPLAEKALQAWEAGEIHFYPKKWENTYRHWLETIRDWCISRQLWWGHRIPVWYCQSCSEMIVSREPPTECPHCRSKALRQEEDVLDTWFSSWLWPFSTLGWPEKSDDFCRFYPTSTLVTAYDIIFFWVSRMIMAGLEFTGRVPFSDIYIHQLVRDKSGRKMSKSLGNGIDPLEIVDEYGADSLKFTLAYLAAQGQDILIDKESFKLGFKFANKVWNASRYLLSNLEAGWTPMEGVELNEVDRWIYARFNSAALQAGNAVENYRFNDAAHVVYDFFWNDFCDWYLEASKAELYSGDPVRKHRSQTLLIDLMQRSLRLLHPFLSFITEEIYSKIPGATGFLIQAAYPEYRKEAEDPQACRNFETLQELVRGVRTLRSEFTLPPEKKAAATVVCDADFPQLDYFKRHRSLIEFYINGSLSIVARSHAAEGESEPSEATKGSVRFAGIGFEAFLLIRDLVDMEKERQKLQKELQSLQTLYRQTTGKLANSDFLSRAPEAVIEKEKGKQAEFEGRMEKIRSYLSCL